VFAVRQGPWKLIASPGGGGPWSAESTGPSSEAPGQLYHLAADLGETENRFAADGERAAALHGLLESFIRQGRSTPGLAQTNNVEVRLPTRPNQRAAADG